ETMSNKVTCRSHPLNGYKPRHISLSSLGPSIAPNGRKHIDILRSRHHVACAKYCVPVPSSPIPHAKARRTLRLRRCRHILNQWVLHLNKYHVWNPHISLDHHHICLSFDLHLEYVIFFPL